MQPEAKIDQTPAEAQEKKEDGKVDPSTNAPAPTSTPTETPEQINWKKFREEREKERKEKLASDKRAAEKEAEASALKAAMDAILNKPTAPAQDNNSSQYEDQSEEERIEQKVNAAIARKEKEYEQKRKEREIAELPHNLQKTFGDFDQTCSTENLDYLEFHYPEVTQAYKYMPEGFDKWASIYKAVKKFVPNQDSRKDSAKAEKNFNKPQSASSPGVSQSGQPSAAFNLTEQRRMENWERMQRTIKGL